MQNYQLDSPINRKMYVPGDHDLPVAPVVSPPHTTETDQTHRHMTWLHNKPANNGVFPMEQFSGRKKTEFKNASK